MGDGHQHQLHTVLHGVIEFRDVKRLGLVIGLYPGMKYKGIDL